MTRTAGVHCLQCGACCHLPELPPYIVPDELDLVPREIREAAEAALELWRRGEAHEGQPCCFWNPDTGLCTVYRHRPSVCREFPAGEELCLQIRAKLGYDRAVKDDRYGT